MTRNDDAPLQRDANEPATTEGYHWTSTDERCTVFFPIDPSTGTVRHLWAKCRFESETAARATVARWLIELRVPEVDVGTAVPVYSTRNTRIVDPVAVDVSIEEADGYWLGGVGLRNGVTVP